MPTRRKSKRMTKANVKGLTHLTNAELQHLAKNNASASVQNAFAIVAAKDRLSQQYVMLGQLAKRVDDLERRQLLDERQFGAHVTFMLGTERRVVALQEQAACQKFIEQIILEEVFQDRPKPWWKRAIARIVNAFRIVPESNYNVRFPMKRGG